MIKTGDMLKLSERGLGEGQRYAEHREWDEHSRFIALSDPNDDSYELLAIFELDYMRRNPAMHYVWRFEVVDEP